MSSGRPAPAALCPGCRSGLVALDMPVLVCPSCGLRFPRLGGLPCLFPDPAFAIRGYRVQVALFALQARESADVFAAQLEKPALLSATRERLSAQLQAADDNVEQILGLLEPLLTPEETGIDDEGSAPSPEALPPLLAYYELLLRDWGWSERECDENTRALSELCAMLPERLGHVLVLGAGAGRLTYDLHRSRHPASTTTLDIDLLLSVVASRMFSGDSLALTEGPSDGNRLASLCAKRTLVAPAGAIEGVRVVLGDGLRVPFPDGAFDTVVTPWFIDQVPVDLRDFLGELDRVLAPGGVWVNLGPLIYGARSALSNYFTIEEVLQLARLGGFRVSNVRTSEGRYLCSPLKVRGRYEIAFAFRAEKLPREASWDPPPQTTGTSADGVRADEPPAWLVLPHLRVPRVPGAAFMVSANPVVSAILEALDGTTSINDLADMLSHRMGVPTADLKDGIRAILLDVHPEARPGQEPRHLR